MIRVPQVGDIYLFNNSSSRFRHQVISVTTAPGSGEEMVCCRIVGSNLPDVLYPLAWFLQNYTLLPLAELGRQQGECFEAIPGNITTPPFTFREHLTCEFLKAIASERMLQHEGVETGEHHGYIAGLVVGFVDAIIGRLEGVNYEKQGFEHEGKSDH